MKVFVNRKIINGPWGGGNNFVSALCDGLKNTGHQVTHNLEPNIDCVFLVDPRANSDCIGLSEFLSHKDQFPNTKIIYRVNECDARKNTEHMDPFLLQCSQYIDKTIFVSKWIQGYFETKGWFCKNNLSIHNGVDVDIFKPGEKRNNRRTSVVAHHWSNNIMKGFDAYEFLDYMAGKGLIDFTYIGRHRNTFNNTKCIDPCTGLKLASNLQGHDVYISGSRFDPGPNHILEALAVKLPTYVHVNGGGAVEFAGHDHIFRNISELEKLILDKNFIHNEYNPIPWETSIQAYLQQIENTVNEKENFYA